MWRVHRCVCRTRQQSWTSSSLSSARSKSAAAQADAAPSWADTATPAIGANKGAAADGIDRAAGDGVVIRHGTGRYRPAGPTPRHNAAGERWPPASPPP